MSHLPALLDANEAYSADFDRGALEIAPTKQVLVLTCIDARVDPGRMLGLELGDAHVLRNAGGRVTDDAIRSATISSWLLGTREFLVIHHTDCGLLGASDAALRARVTQVTGEDVGDLRFLPFDDAEGALLDDVRAIEQDRRLAFGSVNGFLYDVTTGWLREVSPA